MINKFLLILFSNMTTCTWVYASDLYRLKEKPDTRTASGELTNKTKLAIIVATIDINIQTLKRRAADGDEISANALEHLKAALVNPNYVVPNSDTSRVTLANLVDICTGHIKPSVYDILKIRGISRI